MFRRLDKFDRPIIGRGGTYIRRGWGIKFGMLIGLHIWGAYIREGGLNAGGILTGFYAFIYFIYLH